MNAPIPDHDSRRYAAPHPLEDELEPFIAEQSKDPAWKAAFDAEEVARLVGEAWDDGNAMGLDGWTGPNRGAGEVDPEAEQARERMIDRAFGLLVGLSSPGVSPALVAGHWIRVEFDAQAETVELAFICMASPDADCHMICPQGCEECDHPRTEQVPYCNPSEFINNHDAVIQTAERQPRITLPVNLSWNGDTYVWTVAGQSAQLLDHDAVKQRLQAAKGHRWDDDQTVSAVLELARPMPTRLALMDAMRLAPMTTRCYCELSGTTETVKHFGHLADAVLALLRGDTDA